VYRLAAHYRRSPDQLSEEEVRAYLLSLRQQGVARGTFQTSQYGLRFLYHHTLGRAWGLFGEKRWPIDRRAANLADFCGRSVSPFLFRPLMRTRRPVG
jgi:Phage integrase, N-terminal SAM-like domain